MAIERISEPRPEPKPLIITICARFLDESMRVQLFSKPQHIQASNTNREPQENCKLLMSSKDSSKLESVTRAMAAEFDLVVAMTENHKRYLTQAFSCGEKTVTLPEEVGDPYGSDRKSYLACVKQIEKGLYALIEEGIIRESMP